MRLRQWRRWRQPTPQRRDGSPRWSAARSPSCWADRCAETTPCASMIARTVARRDRHHPDWDAPARIERCGAAGASCGRADPRSVSQSGCRPTASPPCARRPGRRLPPSSGCWRLATRCSASTCSVRASAAAGGQLRPRAPGQRARARGFTFGYNLPLPAERVQDVLTAIRFARDRVGPSGRVLLLGSGPAAAWAAGARALAGTEVDRAALDPAASALAPSLASTRRSFFRARSSTVTSQRSWRCQRPGRSGSPIRSRRLARSTSPPPPTGPPTLVDDSP